MKSLLSKFGYELKKIRNLKSAPSQLNHLLRHYSIEVVLDVGANVGQYSQKIRGAGYKNKIISFEPLRNEHQILQKKVKTDPEWYLAHRMALSKVKGRSEIYVSPDSDMSSLLDLKKEAKSLFSGSVSEKKESVELNCIDDILEGPENYVPNIDAKNFKNLSRIFLKLDTQGTESDILDGAKRNLKKIVGIQLEMSILPIYEGEPDYRSMTEKLQNLGFELSLIIPGYFSPKHHRMLQFDGVFFRPDNSPYS